MATSRLGSSKSGQVDPMQKRIPENPKFKHVKSTIDTGASMSKYMNKLEDIRKNYKFRKDEIFKRMKSTTFVQLVIQVYRVTRQDDYDHEIPETPNESARLDTADQELRDLDRGDGSPAPSLALTEGDYGRDHESVMDTQRSTLLSVARGVGELDLNQQGKPEVLPPSNDLCPYLLLDVRESDQYNECHIISAVSYPKANLSKSQNYESKQMLAYKNQIGRIIIIYDDDERLATISATTLVQRGYDNLFMLSGGLKVAYQKFPDGLITGTIPAHLVESPPGKGKKHIQIVPAKQLSFTTEDIDCCEICLDNALRDNSVGSRLSKASTSSSRTCKTAASNYSSMSTISERPPFR